MDYQLSTSQSLIVHPYPQSHRIKSLHSERLDQSLNLVHIQERRSLEGLKIIRDSINISTSLVSIEVLNTSGLRFGILSLGILTANSLQTSEVLRTNVGDFLGSLGLTELGLLGLFLIASNTRSRNLLDLALRSLSSLRSSRASSLLDSAERRISLDTESIRCTSVLLGPTELRLQQRQDISHRLTSVFLHNANHDFSLRSHLQISFINLYTYSTPDFDIRKAPKVKFLKKNDFTVPDQ